MAKLFSMIFYIVLSLIKAVSFPSTSPPIPAQSQIISSPLLHTHIGLRTSFQE